jgi:hypothetical protein
MTATAVSNPTQRARDIPFDMPEVNQGDIVLYWLGADEKEHFPAMVVEVGDRALTLKVFVVGREAPVEKFGVRHARDPLRGEYDSAGVWDFRPCDLATRELLAKITLLEAEIGPITGADGKKKKGTNETQQ